MRDITSNKGIIGDEWLLLYKICGCVNMMSDAQKAEYNTLLGQSIINEITQNYQTMKQLKPLNAETDKLIDETFDSL